VNTPGETALLVTDDRELTQLVQAAAATRGQTVTRVAQPSEVRSRWRDAHTVFVGADLAEIVARLALPPREGVHLVGPAGTEEQLVHWSMPLRADVVALPVGSRWLDQALSGASSARGPVVAVVGGTGGVGATTLAAGLALAIRKRRPAALVDVDAPAGGIDLVVGAEARGGWRWDTLRSASGQLADLAGQLPTADGVAVVAASRTDRREPPPEAVRAVLDGLARTGAVVVADLGRRDSPAREEAIRQAGRIVVVTGQSVRSVASAAALLTELTDRRLDLVVRTGRAGAIAPPVVAEALGLPLLGTVPDTPALVRLADRGIPPGRAAGRRWFAACSRLGAALAGAERRPRAGRWSR